jgi:hypothetical protein
LGNDGTTHKAWQESGVCNLPGMGKFVDQQLAFCRISLGMAAKRIGIGAAKITIDLPIDTRCRKPTSTQTAKVGQDDLVVGDGIPKDFAGQIDLGLGKRMRVNEGITHRPGCYSCNNSENEHNTYSCAQGCCNHKHSHAAEHPNGAARTQVGMNPADSLLCYGDDGTHSRADDSGSKIQNVLDKAIQGSYNASPSIILGNREASATFYLRLCKLVHSMKYFFDNYLTYITVCLRHP